MNDERDPVISDALSNLRVPEHQPGFWERLDARLAAEEPIDRRDPAAPPAADPPATHPRTEPNMLHLQDRVETEPEAVASLEERRARRGGSGRLWAAAAAMIALVATVASLALPGDGISRLATADDPPPSETAPSTRPEPPPAAPPSAEEAVVEWLEAIGAGDTAKAVALIGPRTAAYFRSLNANLEGFVIEAGEGYGAWADTPDLSTTQIDVPTDGPDEVAIVVVSGTWTGEGEDGYRSDAIPAVRGSNGEWLVEPNAFAPTGGRLELLTPEPGEAGLSGVGPDAVLEAAAPGRGAFYFALDGGPLTKVEGRTGSIGVRASYDPPGDMSSRTHMLVVVYVDGDATITAFAGTFVVEG